MEKKPKEQNKKFSVLLEEDSNSLKRYLGRGWFEDFQTRFNKSHGKNSCPKYSHVINVLNGRTRNFKVLALIREIAAENKKIEDSIKELVEA